MSSLKLYGARFGTSLKCHWLLAEMGVSYESIPINILEGENRKPEFLKLNPNAEIPTLVDGDFVLYESVAINQYLAEKYQSPLLGGSIKEKALILQWSLWGAFHIPKYMGPVLKAKFRNIPMDEAMAEAKEHFPFYLDILNKALEGKEWLVADTFSLADIDVAVLMTYADFVEFDYSAYPNVVRWMKACLSRPAFIEAKGQ